MNEYHLRLNEIEFHSGVVLKPNAITVFVGPNNGGKTTLLRELYLSARGSQGRRHIIRSVSLTEPTDWAPVIERAGLKRTGAHQLAGLGPNLQDIHQIQPTLIDNDARKERDFRRGLTPFLAAFIETAARLKLSAQYNVPTEGYKPPASLLLRLYEQPNARECEAQIREEFRRVGFGLDICFDFATPGQLCLRVAPKIVPLPPDPRDARPLLDVLSLADDQGDGVRSFLGVLVALKAADRDLFIIDEPELFLHPPQAFQMGQLLARSTGDHRQLFVATHSPDVLRGILSIAPEPQLVRVTRQAYTPLSAALVRDLASNPILSANRVLEGIFYSAAVVVEGDNDALFYSRVSQKVCPSDDVHYVRAHNKQTLKNIVAPYRAIGLPVSIIADFDILRSKDEFAALLKACGADTLGTMGKRRETIVDEIEKEPPAVRLARVETSVREIVDNWPKPLDASDGIDRVARELRRAADAGDAWRDVKRRGRDSLPSQARSVFDVMDQWCREYGVFIVTRGELESWLVEYGLDYAKSKTWIERALTLLEQLPVDSSVGVWDFIRSVHDRMLSRASPIDGRQANSKDGPSTPPPGEVKSATVRPTASEPLKTPQVTSDLSPPLPGAGVPHKREGAAALAPLPVPWYAALWRLIVGWFHATPN